MEDRSGLPFEVVSEPLGQPAEHPEGVRVDVERLDRVPIDAAGDEPNTVFFELDVEVR